MTSFAPTDTLTPTPGASYLQPAKAALCDTGCEDSTALMSISPETAIDYASVQYVELTLEQCVRRALAESDVFRELGGAIVNQTSSVRTAIDPALRYTDPRSGEEAALSAFDANFASSLFYENNDRPFNNRFSGEDGLLKQDLLTSQTEFNKLAATGTLFTSRATVNYDANNQTGNRFGSSWEAIVDSGFRHPLLQGSGSMFNRIAGPSRTPGQYNGILIARTNSEISLADFEDSVREFVSNVENAYWDLYYAYRELDAQTAARDAALIVKQQAEAKKDQIGELELASAREQLLRFESAIIESMEGRLVDGTQANGGTSGGSFRRTVGVRTAERRLRYLLGMPITDGSLVKPADQPTKAALAFDWQQSVQTALGKRPETRRQKWLIKQKELELTAARNFLMPRLDLVGNYRFRGLGKHLAGRTETLVDDINANVDSQTARSSAFTDLGSGNFQEVQFGAELRLPVGFRQANTAVRNAELSVQRERSILKEQERKLMLDLSNVIAECRRAFNAMQVADQRFNAAQAYRKAAVEGVRRGRTQYDVLLEAQRRMLEAQLQFINAEVEYAVAIKNVHFERATFLNYHGIALSEGDSDPDAYVDYAARRARMTKEINYVVHDARISEAQSNTSGIACPSCGMGTCVCGGEVFGSQAIPPVVSTADASTAAPDEPLPAHGLGKKHTYAPTNLPSSGKTGSVPGAVVPPANAPATPVGSELPPHGQGKKHDFTPNFLPPPNANPDFGSTLIQDPIFVSPPTFSQPPTFIDPPSGAISGGMITGQFDSGVVLEQPSTPSQPEAVDTTPTAPKNGSGTVKEKITPATPATTPEVQAGQSSRRKP
jgi:outer membrane protein TolC